MQWLKTLHIVCGVCWIGNFVVTGVWSLRAFATRRGELARFATREILFTDVVFTLLFGAGVLITGVALANLQHLAWWPTFWTRAALLVVVGAAIVWLAVLLPLELRMHALARTNDPRITSLFVVWNVVGWSVTVVLLGVIYLMVAQPA